MHFPWFTGSYSAYNRLTSHAHRSPCTLFPTNACSRARAFLQRRSRKFETRNATAYAEFVNKLGNKLGTTAYLCRLCPSFLDGEAFFRCRLCWLILGHAAVGVTFVSMQRGSRRSLRVPKILSLQAKHVSNLHLLGVVVKRFAACATAPWVTR